MPVTSKVEVRRPAFNAETIVNGRIVSFRIWERFSLKAAGYGTTSRLDDVDCVKGQSRVLYVKILDGKDALAVVDSAKAGPWRTISPDMWLYRIAGSICDAKP